MKNCPRCISHNTVVKERGSFGYYVECLGCGLKTPNYKTIQGAITKWNNYYPLKKVKNENKD